MSSDDSGQDGKAKVVENGKAKVVEERLIVVEDQQTTKAVNKTFFWKPIGR
jgi:hypothetical protein